MSDLSIVDILDWSAEHILDLAIELGFDPDTSDHRIAKIWGQYIVL
jgi:hypothetical protein